MVQCCTHKFVCLWQMREEILCITKINKKWPSIISNACTRVISMRATRTTRGKWQPTAGGGTRQARNGIDVEPNRTGKKWNFISFYGRAIKLEHQTHAAIVLAIRLLLYRALSIFRSRNSKMEHRRRSTIALAIHRINIITYHLIHICHRSVRIHSLVAVSIPSVERARACHRPFDRVIETNNHTQLKFNGFIVCAHSSSDPV